MAHQISIAFHLLVLASVASGRDIHHGHHRRAMAPSPMPFTGATGISIALPPTALSPAPEQEPQHFAMAPLVQNIHRSPSPAPSHAKKAHEGSPLAGAVKASPAISGAKGLIGKALDALAPIVGSAKDELKKQAAKMAADEFLQSLAPEGSDGEAIKDVLDKVGGIGGASDAINNVISSSGMDVKDMISKVLNAASPSTEDATKTTSSDLEKMIAAAAAAQEGSETDNKQEVATSAAFSATRSSSVAGMMAVVAATACFMF